MAPKAKEQAKGPKLSSVEKKPVEDLFISHELTGWRDVDRGRLDELKRTLKRNVVRLELHNI